MTGPANIITYLAYGWSAGNLNWPIRIQQAGKILVSWCKVDKSGKGLKSGTFLTGDGVRYPRKGIFNFENHNSWQKLKSVSHFVFLNFYFGAKNAKHVNSLVVRRVSQGRIIIVLFWTKYAVPRQIKPGILKSTTSRGQTNWLTVFIFVSCEEKGCYRIIALGHQNFDCRSYCGLSRRIQGRALHRLSLTNWCQFFYASVLLLMINCIITLSKFSVEPLTCSWWLQ